MADQRGGNRRVRRLQRAPSNESDHDGSRSHSNSVAGFNKGKAIGVNPLELAEKQKKQNEFRKKYSDLIETCQTYRDKDGIEPDLEEVMADNIREGNKLFQRIGGGPGDMYMAFLHTKMCSGMILSKTEKIGNSSSGFSLDGFLSQISKRATEEYGDNSPMSIVRWIGPDAAKGRYSLPALTVLLGAFDRESIQTPPEVKEKKPRAANRRKFDQDDQGGATYHEEVRMSEPERQEKEKNNPEIHAQEILRMLASEQKTKKTPENLYEFAMNKESIAVFFENLFYIAFLVKDGYVSIRRRKRAARDRKLLDSDLLIAQEESQPKKKHTEQDESSTRYQHILSFNSRVYRALAESSQGPPTIVRTKSIKSRQK